MIVLNQTMLIICLMTFNEPKVPDNIKDIAKELITEAYSTQDSDTIVAHMRRLVVKLGIQIDKENEKVEEGSDNGTTTNK